MRTRIPDLEEAFTGRFDEHHRFLLARMLARIDGIDADIAAVDVQIGVELAPFAQAAARLDEIPGIGPVAAAVIIAEIGPTCPGSRPPGTCVPGRSCPRASGPPPAQNMGNGSTGHGNPYLARVLGETAVGTGRTDTFLGARYRRIARRRSKKRAVLAVGRAILVITWHLLNNPATGFKDLGADQFNRHLNPDTAKHAHVRQLEALGYTVTLTPAA